MEINDPNGNRNTIWYVTNGLLTVELVSGKMKTGDNSDQQRAPSSQLVAGDPQGNPGTPSYAAFQPYVTIDGATNRSYNRSGEYVTQFLDGNGGLSNTSHNGVMFASYQDATGHNIPNVFWTWMNDPANGFRPQEGVDWLFVLGYPISEPFWIDSTVGGQVKRVLVQLYERRVLTYTASNPQQYRVEFGNIGQHYHWWRYSSPSTPTPSPTPTHTPSPTPTRTPSPTPTEQGSDYPREGAVVYQPDMSAFQSWVSPDGFARSYWEPASSSYVLETRYPVTADVPDGLYYWWESWDGPRDYSVTVDIVTLMTDSSGYNEAGLQYRVESSGSSIRELGETVTATDGTVASWYVGQSDAYLHANYTSVPSYNHGYGAVNQLKVIVKGRHAWVFLNGTFVNDFQLDSRLSTSANGFGMVIWRFGPNSQSVTKFGFRNLVVRAVN
ncbi:MAG: hypothetical protein DCC58_16540 [Chloroflexi bacterium]|nr:MAG: hypothetical protein DCC58_16540 [Chloroflexota bacterium]